MIGGSGWTEADVPDQTGRVAVVTGANSGIGLEATRILADAGATVVMACRSVERGEAARADIEATGPGAELDVRECDLGDMASVATFAEDVVEDHDALHILCNNAGVMAIPRRETTDGFERQLGVNHLGHFALTGHLLGRLRETEGTTRVVTQSSGVHEWGRIDFADLQSERSYDEWDAYAQSKLANLLFAYELDRRLAAAGASVESVGCHPGYAATGLQRRGPAMRGSTLRLWAVRLGNRLLAQSAASGALPMVYAATADAVSGGDFVGPGGLLNMRGPPTVQRSSARSYDTEQATRLWEASAELTGIEYDLPAPT